jgi:hypothetical protein
MKINPDILKEVINSHADQKWLKEMEAIDKETRNRLYDMNVFFNNFEGNINKVAELIEKVPDDSVVRPNRTWLNMFGIK